MSYISLMLCLVRQPINIKSAARDLALRPAANLSNSWTVVHLARKGRYLWQLPIFKREKGIF
jgi:hypothetical protein